MSIPPPAANPFAITAPIAQPAQPNGFVGTPAPVNNQQVHVVQPNENLSVIAARYGLSWRDIYNANQANINDPTVIFSGQQLVIPGQNNAPVAPPIPPQTQFLPNNQFNNNPFGFNGQGGFNNQLGFGLPTIDALLAQLGLGGFNVNAQFPPPVATGNGLSNSLINGANPNFGNDFGLANRSFNSIVNNLAGVGVIPGFFA